jgi:hypothetical protein
MALRVAFCIGIAGNFCFFIVISPLINALMVAAWECVAAAKIAPQQFTGSGFASEAAKSL